MKTLAELLASIGEDLSVLSDGEIRSLLDEIVGAAKTAREGEVSSDTLDALRQARTVVAAIRTEISERDGARAELAANADAALAEIVGPEDDEEEDAEPESEEGDGDEEADGGDEEASVEAPAAEAPADAPAEAGVDAGQPEQIAAAAPPKRRRNVTVPAQARPRPTAPSGASLVASGELPGIAAGHRFNNANEVMEAVAEKARIIRGGRGGVDGPISVARIDWSDQYPPERTLQSASPSPEEFEHAVAAAITAAGQPDALTAAGICGPPEPRYDQITYGATRRPLKAGLPGVRTPRGQLIYNSSPVLSDVVIDTTDGAIDTISNSDDQGGHTKTVQTVACPSPTTATVGAKSLRWKISNFTDRFNPERLPALVGLGQVAFAREQERALLNTIKTGSTKWTNTPAELGAYRDFRRHVMGVVEWYRDSLRDPDVSLTAIIPSFVPAMLVTDLVAQQPGDSVYDITVESVVADIRAWGVNPIFTLDSIRGAHLTTPSGQSPRTPGFDADVEWAVFPTGSWLYMDGGVLDLGVVRDSTLNAANDFETFYEAWETVTLLAPFSHWITSSLCATGDSQVATDSVVCSPQGS